MPGVQSMTDRELKQLSRSELLEMLIGQMQENELLREQLRQAQAELDDRRIVLDRAGSLAEAALQLNDVFRAADRAAKQYVDSVRRMAEEGRSPL